MADLTDLLYDAAVDPSLWPAFLAAFVKETRADLGALLFHTIQDDEAGVVCYFGWDPADLRRYEQDYFRDDSMRVATQRWPEGIAGAGAELCPRPLLEASTAFREFYEPLGAVYSMGGKILAAGTAESVVSVHRGRNAGPFGDAEKAVLQPLLPHLKRAALMQQRLDVMRQRLRILTDHLDHLPQAVFLTDDKGRVLYSSAAARDAVKARDGLSIEDERIRLPGPREQKDLLRSIAKVACGAAPVRLVVSKRSGASPYRLILLPGHSPELRGVGFPTRVIMILVIDPLVTPEPDVNMLAAVFFLTPAEAVVAGKLAVGRTLGMIAAELDISVETARTHVKRVLAKTQTARQGELISLILRSTPLRLQRPSTPIG